MKRILFSLLTAAFAVGVCPAAEPDETPLPGLWQIKNGDWSTLRRELGPVMGTVDGTYTSPIDGVETRWAEFDSWHYEGQVYLEAGKTYTFGTYVDDFCDISIGGQKVHSQLGNAFGSASYACTATGWHDIVFDVWDTGGGFGSSAAWPLGIAWNTAGQTAQDPQSGWTQLVDPGDGSLFRVVGKPKRAVVVENVVCAQRYPWNGMVDIDYEVVCDDPDADVWVYATGYDGDMNVSMAPRALSGDGAEGPVKPGRHRMTWNVTADYPGFASTSFTVKMCALVGGAPYLVVDLSGGVDALSYPVSYLNSVPEGGWGDEYKTTKLVLRKILGEGETAEWAIPEAHTSRTAELLDMTRKASGFTWPELLARTGGLNADTTGVHVTIGSYAPVIHAENVNGVEKALLDMGATGISAQIAEQIYSKYHPADLEGLRQFMPHVKYAHGKFYYVDENLHDPSIPMEKVLKVFDEADYDGYISSEYEGHFFGSPEMTGQDTIEQLRRHIQMEKNILGY